MSDYPEHEKLTAQPERHQAVQDFLDFLDDQGWVICSTDHPVTSEYLPLHKPKRSIVAEFMGVDEEKFELEKRALLAKLREANAELDS